MVGKCNKKNLKITKTKFTPIRENAGKLETCMSGGGEIRRKSDYIMISENARIR